MRTKYGWQEKHYEFWYKYALYKLEVYVDKYVIEVPCCNTTIVVSTEGIERFYRNIIRLNYGLPHDCRAGIRAMLKEYIPSLNGIGTAEELTGVIKKIKNLTK